MINGRRGRRLLGGLATVLAIGVVAAVAHGLGGSEDAPDDSSTATTTAGPSATPAPAGVVSGGQVVEPGPGQPVATDADPVNGTGQVSVVVTFAGWSEEIYAAEVSGFVSGVVEDGGTCRLVLTGPGDPISDEVAAAADAATTSCGSLSVPRDQLEPGTWEAVLSYESVTSSGSSDSFEIEVPES